ncbi:MAG: helix-turn-helix transcriptional regulator [Clostridiales bacterium]|nr:helix-turn-helix transcriptional regulator [Clostridiales bacterium]
MTIAEATAQRILGLCKERNITINKISNMSGVTQSTVNDIVSGTTANPGVATIQKLCDGLDITIRGFFDCDLFDDLEPALK